MTENFELASGKNRALVCYCCCKNVVRFEDIVNVFYGNNISLDPASKIDYLQFSFSEPQTALNIALSWGETSRRLRVGGNFRDVFVGVFFYNAPTPPPAPEPDPDEEPDDEPEPPQPPSITSLVCDALRETFGGVYGASAFVIPDDITSYTLEVE